MEPCSPCALMTFVFAFMTTTIRAYDPSPHIMRANRLPPERCFTIIPCAIAEPSGLMWSSVEYAAAGEATHNTMTIKPPAKNVFCMRYTIRTLRLASNECSPCVREPKPARHIVINHNSGGYAHNHTGNNI